MDNPAPNPSGDKSNTLWDRLDAFLQTDPRDAGCDQAMDMLDVYAELVAAGGDPSERYPGIRAHLRSCGPCAQDLDGLLAVLEQSGTQRDP